MEYVNKSPSNLSRIELPPLPPLPDSEQTTSVHNQKTHMLMSFRSDVDATIAQIEELVKLERWEDARNVFCNINGSDLLLKIGQLPCFETLTKNLPSASLKGRQQMSFDYIFRRQVIFHAKNHNHEPLQKLLRICPAWVMPKVLEDLADNEHLELLPSLLKHHEGLASIFTTAVKSYANDPSAQKLQAYLERPICHAESDAVASKVSALLDELENYGDWNAIEKRVTDLTKSLQEEFDSKIALEWGSALSLAGNLDDPGTRDTVLLLIAVSATSEATLPFATELKEAFDKSVVEENYESPAGKCALRALKIHEKIHSGHCQIISGCLLSFKEWEADKTLAVALKPFKVLPANETHALADLSCGEFKIANRRALTTLMSAGLFRIISRFNQKTIYHCCMALYTRWPDSLCDIWCKLEKNGHDPHLKSLIVNESGHITVNLDSNRGCRSLMLGMASALYNNHIWKCESPPGKDEIFWCDALKLALRCRARTADPHLSEFNFSPEHLRSLFGGYYTASLLKDILDRVNTPVQVQFIRAVWHALGNHVLNFDFVRNTLLRNWAALPPVAMAFERDSLKSLSDLMNSIDPTDLEDIVLLGGFKRPAECLVSLIKNIKQDVTAMVFMFLARADNATVAKACAVLLFDVFRITFNFQSKLTWRNEIPDILEQLIIAGVKGSIPRNSDYFRGLKRLSYLLVAEALRCGRVLGWGRQTDEKLRLMYDVLMEAVSEKNKDVTNAMTKLLGLAKVGRRHKKGY